MDEVEIIRARGLGNIPHGFLGRRAGISTGVAAGLNVGSGAEDNANDVARNRVIAAEAVLAGAALVTLQQVHSSIAVIAEKAWATDVLPQADAMVTNKPGLLLGIVTADCAPILLADKDAGVVGAAHAGWRGAYGGIVESTISAMERIGARRSKITAAIGPCIAQESYEVDDRFRNQFGEDAAGFFAAGKPGHHQFDLSSYVAFRLKVAGIDKVEALQLDTYADESRFYSYRRATHLGQATYGRQFSLIGLS